MEASEVAAVLVSASVTMVRKGKGPVEVGVSTGPSRNVA
jgi:hypothetical protein